MARRWVEFSRDVLAPAYPWWGDWLRVTGATKSGIAHAHVVWFGGYLPHDWLVINWGRFSGGDDSVWLDEVKGSSGAGVSKYLGRQFVEYLAGQGVRARWSKSQTWLSRDASGRLPGVAGRGPSARPGASSGLDFVQSQWYRGHDGPVPAIWTTSDGQNHTALRLGELLQIL
jgi:hypothetical protein